MVLGVLHADGEIGLYGVGEKGFRPIARIKSHKRSNFKKDKPPVADFVLRQATPNSVGVYIYEAYGTCAVYEVIVA